MSITYFLYWIRWYLLIMAIFSHITATNITNITEPTALSVKTSNPLITSSGKRMDDFKRLLRTHNAFIDKSIFIKEILERGNKTILITRPRKWGKSVNLNMLKLFLKIEVTKECDPIPIEETEQYKIFQRGEIAYGNEAETLENPMLISRHADLLNKYQGKYPVIYVPLVINRGRCFKSLMHEIMKAISVAFAEYRYMFQIFTRIILDRNETNSQKSKTEKRANLFHKYLSSEKMAIDKVQTSLVFLSKILFEHFKKPVFLLLDDYEAPLRHMIVNQTFIAKEKPKFYNFYKNLLVKTVNNNRYIEKAIITGTMKLPFLKCTTHSINDVNDTLHKFFGFYENEVNWLFDYYSIKQSQREKATERYRIELNNGLHIYNPWSIDNFAREKKIKNYWLDDDDGIDHVRPLLEDVSFRGNFTRLVFNKKLPAPCSVLNFDNDDFMYFQNFLKQRVKENITYIALAYYHANGHLLSDVQDNETVILRFSSNEIGIEMRNELARYLRSKIGVIDTSKIKKEINTFRAFMFNGTNENCTQLAKVIHNMLNFRIRRADENRVHQILNYLTLYVESYDEKLQSEISSHLFPDLVFIRNDRYIIVKFLFKAASAESAIFEAKSFRRLFPLNRTQVFIGINIKAEKKVEIRMEEVPVEKQKPIDLYDKKHQ